MRDPSIPFRWLFSLLLLSLAYGSLPLMAVFSSEVRSPDSPGGVLAIVGEATLVGNELNS